MIYIIPSLHYYAGPLAHGVYDPKRVFGVTSLDVVRASTFVSQIKSEVDPTALRVNVVGGHSGTTVGRNAGVRVR